ncbi:hypothetical protein EV652_103413 [Kribbella steppae]|uniref:Uncharacterized protein n=1 Tax=Kribbella steppae TaxID=2512223 RepID=A0A4R2HQF5_9ACTN|nr:hypothetical protein [Kribbella steppae]TCO33412.1 hypothetical protein EV652_103413 [Kribbella steppae]
MSETIRSTGGDGPDPSTSRGKSQSVRLCCIYLATTAGLLCVIAVWGLGGALTSVVVIAAMTAIIASSVWGADGRSGVRKIARVTLAGGLIGPAALGLIASLKFAGVLIVLALALTTPALTSRVLRRRAQGDPPAAHPESATPRIPATPLVDSPAAAPERDLRSLDDAALCLAWRRSFVLLEGARSAVARLSVVEQRQQYLDELYRRSPEGLAAWLASGARASGNPLPYVDDAKRRAS